ncbi:MAG: outer membrane protein assembly factor BamE domain-containing protein [Candidatus Binataceae bacterium]
MKRYLPLVFAFYLLGCATVGRPLNQGAVESLKLGVTTYAQVRAQMGSPSGEVISADGRRAVSYVYARSTSSPAIFIPILGPFLGDIGATSQTLYLSFAPNGVLEDYNAGSSDFTARAGL